MKHKTNWFGVSTQPRPAFTTIVSGLPRSGTSLMMKMLEAGGITPLQDGVRVADEDNPNGYYELERVKQIDKGDVAWIASAQGKAVKVIATLLPHLPLNHHYRILFMQRDTTNIIASQAKMLLNRGEIQPVGDEVIKSLYREHLQMVETWLRRHQIPFLYVDYHRLVTAPESMINTVDLFLGRVLDRAAMSSIANPMLYRNRLEA